MYLCLTLSSEQYLFSRRLFFSWCLSLPELRLLLLLRLWYISRLVLLSFLLSSSFLLFFLFLFLLGLSGDLLSDRRCFLRICFFFFLCLSFSLSLLDSFDSESEPDSDPDSLSDDSDLFIEDERLSSEDFLFLFSDCFSSDEFLFLFSREDFFVRVGEGLSSDDFLTFLGGRLSSDEFLFLFGESGERLSSEDFRVRFGEGLSSEDEDDPFSFDREASFSDEDDEDDSFSLSDFSVASSSSLLEDEESDLSGDALLDCCSVALDSDSTDGDLLLLVVLAVRHFSGIATFSSSSSDSFSLLDP